MFNLSLEVKSSSPEKASTSNNPTTIQTVKQASTPTKPTTIQTVKPESPSVLEGAVGGGEDVELFQSE